MDVSRHQKFEIHRLDRAELHEHPYNPRQIDRYARERLQKNLARVGLLTPLIWNRRTGHLVGGHQRLSVLDALHKGKPYLLDVSAIDVDEKTERELVVFLNSRSAQGEWDLDALERLVRDAEFDFTKAGFSAFDLEALLADRLPDGLFNAETTPQVKKTKATIEEIKEAKRQARRDRAEEAPVAEFYVICVFGKVADKKKFLGAFGFEDHEYYLDGQRFPWPVGVIAGEGDAPEAQED